MTWTKFGSEFFDECANANLSDAATRTHSEAIGWLYRVEQTDLLIPRHLMRRFVGSPIWEDAVQELVSKGFWRVEADAYVLDHHADVIRQSIAAQQSKRARDKKAQANYRVGKRPPRVSADVSADTDSQTDKQASTSSERADVAEAADQPFLPKRSA